MNRLKALQVWFQGKKTMLGGCLILVAAVAGVAAGRIPVDQGIVVVGLGVSICGWSARANRHQAEILDALQTVATAGAAYRAGNKSAAMQAITGVVAKDATKVVVAEAAAGSGAAG